LLLVSQPSVGRGSSQADKQSSDSSPDANDEQWLSQVSTSQLVSLLGRIAVLRPSSVVCRSVTLVSPAKTAELIEMPFGLWTRMGQGIVC